MRTHYKQFGALVDAKAFKKKITAAGGWASVSEESTSVMGRRESMGFWVTYVTLAQMRRHVAAHAPACERAVELRAQAALCEAQGLYSHARALRAITGETS